MCVRQIEYMNAITFNQLLDSINQLPLEQQEMLLEISRKRLIEMRRQEIARDAQASLRAFREGRFTAQSAEQVIQELHESLNADDA